MQADRGRHISDEGEGEGEGGGRILALDFGDRRIGIAVSDELALYAHPLMTLERTSWKSDLETIRRIAEERHIHRVVVGMPLDMDGNRGLRAGKTEGFMARLRRSTGLEVVPWDERLTTVEAERALLAGDMSRARRRRVIDQVAAVIILQSYLDAQGAGRTP